MRNESIVTALFHVTNSSVFDPRNNSDTVDHHYVIEKYSAVFTIFGIILAIFAISFNVAIIVASVVKNALTPFSLQTIHLMTSLAVADLLLLVFGLPYDLVAASDGYWLDGPIGCHLSSYLPEVSRFAWVGTVLLAMPLRWPSTMQMRKWGPVWTLLVWVVSLAAAIPFALHVDCLALSATTGDTEPEAVDSLAAAQELCFCVFATSQSEVVHKFGSSLLVFSLAPAIAIAMISWKRRTYTGETPAIKWVTSPRRLAIMLLAFMACTLPRYVRFVVIDSEYVPKMDDHYGLALAIMEIICYSLFYCSTLIHLIVSPHPRALLRQFCSRHRHQQNYIVEN